MPIENKPRSSHPRIVVGLPDLQEQIRMVDRLAGGAAESDSARWRDIGQLLSELYSQLQTQKQVTIYRFGRRDASKSRA